MKVEFLSPLRVECVNERCWVISEDFSFSVDGEPDAVPAGTRTDFASVPRLPLAYLIAGGVSYKAPVIHDYLYTKLEDRKRADQVFMAALKEEGVPRWKRTLMYAAVRAFGRAEFQRRP